MHKEILESFSEIISVQLGKTYEEILEKLLENMHGVCRFGKFWKFGKSQEFEK